MCHTYIFEIDHHNHSGLISSQSTCPEHSTHTRRCYDLYRADHKPLADNKNHVEEVLTHR